MKKMMVCAIAAICVLTGAATMTGCTSEVVMPEYAAQSSLPSDYSAKQAALDGCVVIEDFSVVSGAEVWTKFVRATKTKQAATVRVVKYYTADPSAYLIDVVFDGQTFNTRIPGMSERAFKFLNYYTDEDKSLNHKAEFEYYILVNDKTLSFERLIEGIPEDQMLPDQIEQCQVYTNALQ